MRSTEELAQRARVRAVKMCTGARAAHIGSSLSVIDILAVLYSGGAEISPGSTRDPDRDYVIVSKGHAAAGTYAVMAEAGFLSEDLLETYGCDEGLLGGHVTLGIPGVELATGSLGHGLPFGLGVALGSKRLERRSQVFVVMSDGECNEGTTWESALIAAHFELDNLTVLIDRNGIQSMGPTEDILRLEPLAQKWRSFGWNTLEVDGHNHLSIAAALKSSRQLEPTAVICRTVKGKGVSFMEDTVLWHYRPPSEEESEIATREILGGSNA